MTLVPEPRWRHHSKTEVLLLGGSGAKPCVPKVGSFVSRQCSYWRGFSTRGNGLELHRCCLAKTTVPAEAAQESCSAEAVSLDLGGSVAVKASRGVSFQLGSRFRNRLACSGADLLHCHCPCSARSWCPGSERSPGSAGPLTDPWCRDRDRSSRTEADTPACALVCS